jgi:hypothetical protein
VPFWLPSEQAFGYPQVPALPADTALRLPYPAIFVAYATPWQLAPTATDGPEPDISILTLMLYARGRAAHNHADTLARVLRRLHCVPDLDRRELPTPLQALSHYGGDVEGLILTADHQGRPADEFAWCLAVRHPTGVPLGRIAVPANIHKTAWRDQVSNIIAGVALSCWHEPVEPTASRAVRKTTQSTVTDATELDVHILDVDRTSPQSRPTEHQGNGRSPRAHIRRGHWRRQHTGHRRTEVRWTWVRPTTVAGLRPGTEQVYVLR